MQYEKNNFTIDCTIHISFMLFSLGGSFIQLLLSTDQIRKIRTEKMMDHPTPTVPNYSSFDFSDPNFDTLLFKNLCKI